MSGKVISTPEPPPSGRLWMRRWITAAMSEAKKTDSEPMKASVPTPMNEKRWLDVRGRRGSISVQRPFIHTASVMRRRATPTMNDERRAEQADADDEDAEGHPERRDRALLGLGRDVVATRSCSTARPSLLVAVLDVPERPLAVDTGSRAKLPCGGGEVVAHSSVQAPPGVVARRPRPSGGCCRML